MSRLEDCFASLKQSNRAALTIYIAAGDPHPGVTVDLMHTLVDAGADIIELGIPFSDPMADGPVIQRACERALKHNVSLNDVLAMAAEFRQQNAQTPLVLMGYMNPIEAMGASDFAHRAKEAGIDGVITVDLPPDANETLIPAMQAADIDPVFLLSPTTTEDRIRQIADVASGFLYYVSLKGVTGANSLDVGDVQSRLDNIGQFTNLPLGVGFGISDAESAMRVAKVADAVVVGSAVVRRVGESEMDQNDMLNHVGEFVAGLSNAVNTARN
ncbi:MAG: tryptophan synthase subunit alpha [Pseudomonadota bacterium]